MTVLYSGEKTTIAVPAGKAPVIVGTHGTSGWLHCLNEGLGGDAATRSWSVGEGPVGPIALMAASQRYTVKCIVGSIDVTDGNVAADSAVAAFVTGSGVVGEKLTATLPAGVVGTLQFVRFTKATPPVKSLISGAVANAVNSLQYTYQQGDLIYDLACDTSNTVQTSNKISAGGTATVDPAPVPATAVTLTGPTSVVVGAESSAYTVTLSPVGGTVASPVTVTPTAITGVSFNPASVSLTTTSPSATFTATVSAAGTKTIAVTSTGGLTAPAAINMVASAAASNVPSAPVIIAATENINDNTTAVVSYVAPSSNGGSALTGYTGVMTMEDGSTVPGTAAAGATSMNFTGVTALKSRSVVIRAVNGNGPGALSAVAKVATLRNVATRCSSQYESSPQLQALGHSTHYNTSGRTQNILKVVIPNYYSQLDTGSGTLSVKVVIEYPPESGIQDSFMFDGALLGSVAVNTNKFSDFLTLTNIVGGIPDGAAFRLKYFFQTTSGGRIPYCHNGSTSKYGAKYDLIRFGASGQDRLTDDAATWNARVNDDATKNYCFKPLAILGYSTADVHLINGDSNTAGGGVDQASDTFLLCGLGEKLVGRGGPFINLAQSGEKLEDWLDASKALRRKEMVPYTTVRDNFYGTNTFANQTDVAALNALDVRYRNEWAPFNKLTTCTMPPKTTPATGPFNTLASQNVDTTQDAKRVAWNAARVAKTAVAFDQVFNIAPLLAAPTDERKWDVHPLGRNLTVSMTAGSNVVTATTGTFGADDPTTELVCVTQASYAGSAPYISDGGLIGLMQYTEATHALITDRAGVARPAGVTVTGLTMHIGLWNVTGDGTHGREAMYQRILPVALTAPL
jgi:hypothetical protein